MTTETKETAYTPERPLHCANVSGGWQTSTNDGLRFGPVFNSCSDLWQWQKENPRALELRPLVERIAESVVARLNCARDIEAFQEGRSGLDPSFWPLRKEWLERHTETLEFYAKTCLPAGGGFDSGSKIDLNLSRPDRIVLETEFHHMNPHGFYDGWTSHRVTLRPAFVGRFNMSIGGRDRNGIKELIAQTFHHALSLPVPHPIALELAEPSAKALSSFVR